MNLTDKQKIELKETQISIIAGLLLNRSISVNDIKWAVEEGYIKGLSSKNGG